MENQTWRTVDGNEAAASIAYQTSEVISIYPITPASPMGEWADQWAAALERNLWDTVPVIQEMQSEGGAAGVVHGALQAGSLATTFTSSQGLLLMLPNMFKIAGELTPAVIHVAARSIASHALSIFGDHSDVMAARATGFGMLCSATVQETQDFALIALAATLETRVPFVHFFDGFRTSHEIAKIESLSKRQIVEMIGEDGIRAHRLRALTPDRPVVRGTAQNPDVFFQAREAANPYYKACPDRVQRIMIRFHALTGRSYRLFDYFGSEDAESVLVLMGSGAETATETVEYLNRKGSKFGVIQVRLFRPFCKRALLGSLPTSVRRIAVLDRTKEPGSPGEPLYLDVQSAVAEAFSTGQRKSFPRVIGGRYGLSSKEFTPAMVKAVFEELERENPRNPFTVGIRDDVGGTSLETDSDFSIEAASTRRAVFWGLGADGTVSANKNSIKIIGDMPGWFAQGYFVYDSKKSGSVTVSHLRFGPAPIRAPYLIERPDFVACHQFQFLSRHDILEGIREEGVLLINSPYPKEELWRRVPESVQKKIRRKRLKVFAVDAYALAGECGLGRRINTIMQTCFFRLAGIVEEEAALEAIQESVRRTYGKLGEEIVKRNLRAVGLAAERLFELPQPAEIGSDADLDLPIFDEAPEFVRNVTCPMILGKGDQLPVSLMPVDGTFPVGTTRWEKRNITQEIPVWDPEICIQCNKCVLVCPHSVIRAKVLDPSLTEGAPPQFTAVKARDREWEGMLYTLQTAPEDCTGCRLCVEVCPVRDKRRPQLKALNMAPQEPLRASQRENWEFFLTIPEVDRRLVRMGQVRQSQLLEPLFEFSGACSGCGETPYLKLMSQLFGDRALVANATGCSSIYGGNLPTTPWTKNREGRGPAWSNSLFEDNAEFGLGMRLAVDQHRAMAEDLLRALGSDLDQELVAALLSNTQKNEADVYEQRKAVEKLKERLAEVDDPAARRLEDLADYLVKKSVWIVGGDGWAYDIGFGGLDHVLSSGRNVNLLVLDTEVYSNTGGQMSKATPRGAVAKFADGGKALAKKDLGLIAMATGNVYVASVAFGAKDEHTVKAFLEAEAYDGPSLILAYSHCIAHGIDMERALVSQKAAVDSGYWPLFRFHPERMRQGENPLQLDSRAGKVPVKAYTELENRFRVLHRSHPERATALQAELQRDVERRFALYEHLSKLSVGVNGPKEAEGAEIPAAEAGR